MNKLLSFLFPVPYPIAAIWHIVLGAIIGAVASQVLDVDDTARAVLWAEIGAGVGLVLGFVLWLSTRKPNLNKRG